MRILELTADEKKIGGFYTFWLNPRNALHYRSFDFVRFASAVTHLRYLFISIRITGPI